MSDKATFPGGGSRELTNSIGLKMVLIPAGSFRMGSTHRDALADEGPVHTVEITKPFYLGAAAVTQSQYEAAMGANPSCFKGNANRPVEMVTWHDAAQFCEKLSAKEKVAYRLPTEAEWEYVCRSASRLRLLPSYRYNLVGCRVLLRLRDHS